MERTLNLAGRLLLAHIFLISGWGKISGYAGTQAYMESMGVAGALLPLVIAVELAGAIALIVGFQTRLAALALGGFTVLAALMFHFDFADSMQAISFMKNMAIAGGLLVLAQTGASAPSVDAARGIPSSTRHARA
jgi:putative oxidoreductase